MDTINDIKSIVEDYDDILARAIDIVAKPPFSAAVENDVIANIAISEDGESATVSWDEHESDYYGGGYNETKYSSFPARLLLASDEELAKELADLRADHAEKERLEQEGRLFRQRAAHEQQERRILAELQKKYGA